MKIIWELKVNTFKRNLWTSPKATNTKELYWVTDDGYFDNCIILHSVICYSLLYSYQPQPDQLVAVLLS